MRTIKLLTVLAIALPAVSGMAADTAVAPTPSPAYPYGYVNPFDPNWWLMTLGNLTRMYTVPGAYPAPAMLPPGGVQAPAVAAAPTVPGYPYVNPFDPNWWLAYMPTAATAVPAAPAGTVPAPAVPAAPTFAPVPAAPQMGSAYVPVQTPYGTIYTFNYADPTAWNKMFAQPFATPAPAK